MIEILKENIKESRKNKNEYSLKILTTLLGDIQLESSRKNRDLTNQECESIVKKFIKNNNETMKHLDFSEPKFIDLANEIILLEDLLPKTLSKKEIGEVLTSKCLDAIITSKNHSQAIGVAMQTLKSLNLSVNGKDVNEVVSEMVN